MNDRELVALRCSALVLRRETVLLCRRSVPERSWVLPGGSPHPGEGAAACARREVLEEAGLEIDVEGVAFVLEATSPDAADHLVEIVLLGTDRDASAAPYQREEGLLPEFVELADLASLSLLPPIGGYIRGLALSGRRSLIGKAGIAPYLGNVWRPTSVPFGEDPIAAG